MQAIILCGGKGTRLSEETQVRPKPMVTVGGHPILWHIMKIYASHGIKNFTLATGYLGEYIKNYFLHWAALNSDFEVDLSTGATTSLSRHRLEDWKVKLIDTGLESMTGGRLKRLEHYFKNEPFLFTYGDGVSDINIEKLIAFHKSHGKLVTISAVKPSARFGGLDIGENGSISNFREKLGSDVGWINGGYMVMEPGVFKYLDGDSCILEKAPLENIAKDKQLMAYTHEGFWQCMDTIRDRELLEDLWERNKAPWKTWND
ncbi:MAG: glucose-1-phosphate cytidylyltransferase [Oligoflexia bacterium]|nr:glucose-1-phosphate cytidylyltransferase [Oligoflexia bacterium]